ncbi:hypothetical protein FJT64_001353 [Amphibalanus amphitrite]|uniref:Uncharacterized protein n=1 Tax=Amphibalanus amphitrite TaxID=1232801 RepID=A0A6A4V575_AMPAM|nr:hypothetical protein FJT64_001353 [Amphibalanus amphitrite]
MGRRAVVCVLWTLAAAVAAGPPTPAPDSAALPSDLRCLQHGPQCAAVDAAEPLARRRLVRLLGEGAARRLGGQRLRQAGLQLVLPCCGAEPRSPPPVAELAAAMVGALVPALRPLAPRRAGDPARLASAADLITASTARCYSVSGQQLLTAWQAFVNVAIGTADSMNPPNIPASNSSQESSGDSHSQTNREQEMEDFLIHVQRFCVMESHSRASFSLPHWIEFLDVLPRLQQLPRCGVPFAIPRTIGEFPVVV